MDYDLDSLGTNNFEQLAQSLVAKLVGPHLKVFGDGPDGGREASWNGSALTHRNSNSWSGYGVLQAKFKQRSGSPAENLSWLKSAIRSELLEWASPESKRNELPDLLLFVTNVRLSSVPDSGKDDLGNYVQDLMTELGLKIAECQTWDYYELRAQLDDAAAIRRRYAAFITAGDVIATLVEEVEGVQEALGQALSTYTAKCLADDSLVNLTQAGTAGDGRVTIEEVFVDLPSLLPNQPWLVQSTDPTDASEGPEADEDEYEFDFGDIATRGGIAQHLIHDFNHIPENPTDSYAHPHRTVLIGGPGQGKSTVTQWLGQMYRAEFLRDSRLSESITVSTHMARVDARRQELGLPAVQARRWPVRIILTDLADYLAKSPDRSLLHYVADKVSSGASFQVDSQMLRKWLETYPWLILIDGLDEVPSSSNRQQVLTAIQDFFLESTSIGADVAAVATTRPQGYSEEFSPKEYRHFQLDTLEVSEALDFAKGLVAVRMGTGTTAEAKVMNRLDLASREEHTRKLFESPLQVTILEVLLEKLHKAPSDRSRLYSAYFNVISQREQEKSGALSDLLQKYENDVIYLHRRIGFELQKRGAAVGETSSSLTSQEFNSFIVERFREQGHSARDVEQLSRDFSVLVTDRLVFLAILEADRIGFELRSLQEFMAGEHIVNFPESMVIDEIQGIAQSSYWRNVVLFAVGSIFANKEHLRAEVVLLCDRLNIDPARSTVLLPGSDLAIEILRDGSCLPMPKYARGLTSCALTALDHPQPSTIQSLVFLQETDFAYLLWSNGEADSLATTSRWIGRATLLSLLHSKTGDRADTSLRQLVEKADPKLKQTILNWAWHTRNLTLTGLFNDGEFTRLSPQKYFHSNALPKWVRLRGREASSLPKWVSYLTAVGDPYPVHAKTRRESDAFLSASYRPLGENVESWAWLSQIETNDPEWLALREVAQFAATPTKETLANALDAIGTVGSGIVPNAIPWPITACIRHAELQSLANPRRLIGEQFADLAAAARAGELGDTATWNGAQLRWGETMAIDEELIALTPENTSELPIWSDLIRAGIAPLAYTFTAKHMSPSANTEETLSLMRTLAMHSANVPTWLDLAVFLADVATRSEELDNLEHSTEIFDLLASKTPAEGLRSQWISWIQLMPLKALQEHMDFLQIVGSAPRLLGTVEPACAETLLELALSMTQGLPLARIALISDPSLVLSIPSGKVEALTRNSKQGLQGALVPIWHVFHATTDQIWSGEYDDQFRAIGKNYDPELSIRWFESLLTSCEENQAGDLAARGAYAIEEMDPILAHSWREIGMNRNRDMQAQVSEPISGV